MKRLAPLLAFALFLLSCDAPFDLSLSQAAAVISKMTLQQTIAPLHTLDGDQENMDIVFLPEKESAAPGIDFQNGFLLLRGTYRTMLRYVRFDSANSSYQVFGGWGQELVNPDPNYQLFVFEPLKFPNLNDSIIGVVGLDPVDPGNSSVQLANANIPSSSLTSGGWLNLRNDFINLIGPGLPYDANVLGYSIYPTDSVQPFDNSYWLVRMNSGIDAGKLREVIMDVSAVGFTSKNDTKIGANAFDIIDLAVVKRCNYFFDPDSIRGPTPDDRKSYVSWFDTTAGSWRCVRWNGAGFTDSKVLPGITHRIDALLTTGMLFSTEGNVGRVYDSSGTEIASFPLGALRFIGERYVDVDGVQTATALFSLARIVTERYSETLAIDLYSIPTAGLETLGK
jgi:hypothetical protein